MELGYENNGIEESYAMEWRALGLIEAEGRDKDGHRDTACKAAIAFKKRAELLVQKVKATSGTPFSQLRPTSLAQRILRNAQWHWLSGFPPKIFCSTTILGQLRNILKPIIMD